MRWGGPPEGSAQGMLLQNPGEAEPEPSVGAMPQACPQPPGTLPAPAGPLDPPVCQLGASAASSSTPAPPADRAPIEAGSCLTCSPPPPKGLQQWAALCALAGAEPAAPRLKYKQPRQHLPPQPRSPGGGKHSVTCTAGVGEHAKPRVGCGHT